MPVRSSKFSNLLNSSSHSVASGLKHPLTEVNTKNLLGVNAHKVHKSDDRHP
jgi:hypothetical protein